MREPNLTPVMFFLFATLGVVDARCERPAPVESVDGATRTRWLIDGLVVDAISKEPIKSFVVTPGTMSTDDRGRAVVRWRDNLKREMSDGVLQWPRTSGFSEMRFRVTARGYRPLVTHPMRRGGPHTRIKVSMTKR